VVTIAMWLGRGQSRHGSTLAGDLIRGTCADCSSVADCGREQARVFQVGAHRLC
jgi:hypothetical protein